MVISQSGYNTYMQCPKKFLLHYRHKLRELTIGSPLIFGQMIDNKLDPLLEGKESKEYVYPQEMVIWGKIDYDPNVLQDEDKEKITKFLYHHKVKYEGVSILIFELFKKTGRLGSRYMDLTALEMSILDIACKLSVARKAELIAAKYEKEVLPLLGNPRNVQGEIKIGDKVRGKIDFIADYDGKEVLFDNKTSKTRYMDNRAATSLQLAIYAYALKMEYVGYIVMLKEFKKGIPQFQLIVDRIPVKLKNMASKALLDTHCAIVNDHFPANLNACSVMFGKKCPYYSHCHYNDDRMLYKKESK